MSNIETRFHRHVTPLIANGADNQTVDAALQHQVLDAALKEYIYVALVEAMKNVKHHAYPVDGAYGLIPSVSKWWAAGAYDPVTETLQFVVYDQGVGIPTTLPRRSFWKSVRRFCKPEITDADIIAGGIRYGRSRFKGAAGELVQDDVERQPQDPAGRGNGLWSICEFIPKLNGSFVRILSGRGEVIYAGGRTPVRRDHRNPFCGTLIEWNLKLSPAESNGRGSS